jgi:hypothetical protein
LCTEIIKKADSIMAATVGEKIFAEHFKFDSTSYFESKTSFNNSLIKTLTKTKKTKGEIKSITIRYTFFIKKFEEPSVRTSLLFDKNLKLIKSIDKSFIPNFILQGTTNGFLTKENILNIAKSKFVKKGIKAIETTLTYDHNKNIYVWTVVNITKERKSNNEPYKEIELLEINASNGIILNFFPNGIQGTIH